MLQINSSMEHTAHIAQDHWPVRSRLHRPACSCNPHWLLHRLLKVHCSNIHTISLPESITEGHS